MGCSSFGDGTGEHRCPAFEKGVVLDLQVERSAVAPVLQEQIKPVSAVSRLPFNHVVVPVGRDPPFIDKAVGDLVGQVSVQQNEVSPFRQASTVWGLAAGEGWAEQKGGPGEVVPEPPVLGR